MSLQMKTPPETNEDVYALAKKMAKLAQSLGDEVSAQDLENALVAGSTASDQLGNLRRAMVRLRIRTDSRWPEEWLRSIDGTIEEIDRAFLRANRGG